MYRYMLGILLIVIVTAYSPATKNNKEVCFIDNNVFVDGEVLVYKIYYNWKMIWIPAGEVKFIVEEGTANYTYSAEGKTYSSYDNFFKVRDYYYSSVDKETLFPRAFVRKVEEGKYYRYDSILFDQQAKTAVSYWGRNPEDAQRFDFKLDGCMQDMLSVLYFIRNHDYSGSTKGDQIPVRIFFDKETYPLKVTFEGREPDKKIKNQGRFRTLKFIPEVIAGYVFKHDTRMELWVSDDDNKIPLLVESPVSIGSIKAVLKRCENLKYPLHALIEKEK